MSAGRLTIGQVASRVGVSVDTIRRYERAGLLPKAARAVNGYRTYAEEDVPTIAETISQRVAKRLGVA